MSFPRYPEYKDSGVEWLGQVPAHWDLRRLGCFVSERREKVSDADYQPLSVTKNGVVPQLETAAKTDDGDNRKLVRSGDFVINSRSDRKGSAGLADLDGSVSLICTVLQLHGELHGPFIHHLLRSVSFQDEYYRVGKGIVADLWSTNFSEMRNILIAMPPLEEQRDVAALLDRETAKIDALVAEQERLIALLKEKRQAVISHAVTKGLNPKAPMKDSGVEWLGEVPSHWEVLPLRRAIFRFEQGWSPECHAVPAEEFEWGVLKAGCVNNGRYNENENKTLPEGVDPIMSLEVAPGDLLMSRASGSPELVGSAALVSATRGRLMLSDKIFRIRTHARTDSSFLAYALNARFMRVQIERAISGADGLANNLPQSAIKTFSIALPPLEEQVPIVLRLGSELEQLDALLLSGQDSVELLLERRAALIAAAVTGQIDVRNVASAEAA